MKHKKIMAFILTMAMVSGSSMAVFAADPEPANGAEGQGTLLPHVNREITAVTLPTTADVANVFDFTLDPEGLIKDSESLADGTAVTGNNDGVYFKNTSMDGRDGTVSYVLGTVETTGYTAVVSDLTKNATYTFDGTAWKNGSDTVTVSITKDSDNGIYTPSNGNTVTVSGAVAAANGNASYSFENGNIISGYTISGDVLKKDGTYTYNNGNWKDSTNAIVAATITPDAGGNAPALADGDTIIVTGAVEAADGTVSYVLGTPVTTGYTVSGVDKSTNATYTYDGTAWKDGSNTAVTGIVIKDASDVTYNPSNGNSITVSGAVAAGTASTTYSSSSDAVKFEGKNSVDVDVTVTATVAAAASGQKNITLVEDAAALANATDPALYMTLTVGDETKAITATGEAKAKATIDGVADNFAVTVDGGAHKYAVKADVDPDTWDATTVQLVGKTNQKSVPTGADVLSVPRITLTWTVTKHEGNTTPAGPTLSNGTKNTTEEDVDFNVTFTKGTESTFTFTGLGDGVTLRSVTQGTAVAGATSATSSITVSGAAFTIKANMWGTASAGNVKYVKLTTSNNDVIVVKVTIA